MSGVNLTLSIWKLKRILNDKNEAALWMNSHALTDSGEYIIFICCRWWFWYLYIIFHAHWLPAIAHTHTHTPVHVHIHSSVHRAQAKYFFLSITLASLTHYVSSSTTAQLTEEAIERQQKPKLKWKRKNTWTNLDCIDVTLHYVTGRLIWRIFVRAHNRNHGR